MNKLKNLISLKFLSDINRLQNSNRELSNKIDSLISDKNKLLWAIENPPKHRIGQKVKEGIVIKTDVCYSSIAFSGSSHYSWRYSVLKNDGSTQSIY